MECTTYNGWKNRNTWNIALWINNDEGLYLSFQDAKKQVGNNYKKCVEYLGLQHEKTPDDVKFISSTLSLRELNQMIKEL